jgi:hypothetical protein
MISIRKLAPVLAAASLAAGVVGISAQAQNSASGGTTTKSAGKAGGPHRGPGGPRIDVSALATKLGVSESALQAALKAIRPTDKPPKGEGRDGFATAIATALGVDTAKVQSILDANRPTTRPAKDARPDDTKLVSALASALGIDGTAVTTALDKVHADHRASDDARHTAMAAALAKQLGLSTDKVSAALEAVRPAGPPPAPPAGG